MAKIAIQIITNLSTTTLLVEQWKEITFALRFVINQSIHTTTAKEHKEYQTTIHDNQKQQKQPHAMLLL